MSDPLHTTGQPLEDLLRATNALERGHFLLQSGRHSDQRLELLLLLQQKSAVVQIAEALVSESRALVGAMGGEIDLVVSASADVSDVAEVVGRTLGVHNVVAGDGFGDVAPPRARVLLVAGDLETGDPIALLLPMLYAAGAHPIAVSAVARRTPALTEIEAVGRDPIPLIAGITLDLPTYEPTDCPLCAAGAPMGAA